MLRRGPVNKHTQKTCYLDDALRPGPLRRCSVCGRALTNRRSLADGMGATCRRRQRAAAMAQRQLQLPFTCTEGTTMKRTAQTPIDPSTLPARGWRRIPTYPEYEAHPDGLVRRKSDRRLVSHWVPAGARAQNITLRLPDGGKRTTTLGRAVAEACCRKPAGRRAVGGKLRLVYLDGNGGNAAAANLQWVVA